MVPPGGVTAALEVPAVALVRGVVRTQGLVLAVRLPLVRVLMVVTTPMLMPWPVAVEGPQLPVRMVTRMGLVTLAMVVTVCRLLLLVQQFIVPVVEVVALGITQDPVRVDLVVGVMVVLGLLILPQLLERPILAEVVEEVPR